MSLTTLSGARVARLATAALVLAATAACGDDKNGPDGSLAGRYNLIRVDDQSPPLFTDCGSVDPANCTASQPDWERLDGATIELSGNGTSGAFTLTLTYTDRFSGGTPTQAPFPISGNYTTSGNNVTFATSLGSLAATHVGDELRLILDIDDDVDDDQVVFKKQ